MSQFTPEELDSFAQEVLYLISFRSLPKAKRDRLISLIEIFRVEREEHTASCEHCAAHEAEKAMRDCLDVEDKAYVERAASEVLMLERMAGNLPPEEPPATQ